MFVNNIFNVIKRSKLLINFLILIVIFIAIYMGTAIVYKITAIQHEFTSMQPTISIIGEASLDKKPDIALLRIGMENEAQTVSKAQQENSETMNSVIEYLKEQEIQEKDLKTSNYSIYPRYEYNHETGKRRLAAYRVEQNINIKIRDFSKISSILNQVTKLGANQIGNITFTIDDEIAAQSEVRALAIQEAKRKAKILAKQLNIKIGDLVDFHESANEQNIYYRDKLEGYGAVSDSVAAPQIEPGTTEITSQVTLIYEIN
jgi:uncharacterized protein